MEKKEFFALIDIEESLEVVDHITDIYMSKESYRIEIKTKNGILFLNNDETWYFFHPKDEIEDEETLEWVRDRVKNNPLCQKCRNKCGNDNLCIDCWHFEENIEDCNCFKAK